ncbi:MAG TPA: ABC transporter substrate-binding protein [Xanthobacteraceae bacterium]|jgi:NitT/TauT family transport system substrate-binding protein|nr:ABC transporter substrate-binding protein [Xanthobacteraceae bacterium]
MALRSALARIGTIAVAAAVFLADAAQAQTSLKLSLDQPLDGIAGFFLMPEDRGYYRDEGLDVAVDEGATALEPITRVASGGHELGFADINALIRYRDQNPAAPVKAVFMLFNTPPFAVVGRKSRGITNPESLEDKKLGGSPSGATYEQWPIFAKLNGIDPARVTIEKIGIPVRAPMLAAGQLDAVLGYSFRVYVDLKDRGVPADDVVLLPMADYGLKLYGGAIIVNSKFAAEKPQAVAGFLRAFTRGLKEAIRNPGAAADSVLKREDLGSRAVELQRLRMAIRDNIATGEVRGNGLGAIDEARLADSFNQIALTYAFKARPRAADIFDPAFLPPAAERKLN